MEQEQKYQSMTQQLMLTNSKEDVGNYIRWIIKSDTAKEYWTETIKKELNKSTEKITYCIEVKRSGEEDCVLHHSFEKEPTREQVLEFVLNEDLNYDDKYGKIDYYRV